MKTHDASIVRLYIPSGIIRLPQQVVDAHMVVVRQPYQDFVGQWLNAGFDVAVLALSDTDGLRESLLGQVGILAQIPDSVLQCRITTDNSMLKI